MITFVSFIAKKAYTGMTRNPIRKDFRSHLDRSNYMRSSFNSHGRGVQPAELREKDTRNLQNTQKIRNTKKTQAPPLFATLFSHRQRKYPNPGHNKQLTKTRFDQKSSQLEEIKWSEVRDRIPSSPSASLNTNNGAQEYPCLMGQYYPHINPWIPSLAYTVNDGNNWPIRDDSHLGHEIMDIEEIGTKFMDIEEIGTKFMDIEEIGHEIIEIGEIGTELRSDPRIIGSNSSNVMEEEFQMNPRSDNLLGGFRGHQSRSNGDSRITGVNAGTNFTESNSIHAPQHNPAPQDASAGRQGYDDRPYRRIIGIRTQSGSGQPSGTLHDRGNQARTSFIGGSNSTNEEVKMNPVPEDASAEDASAEDNSAEASAGAQGQGFRRCRRTNRTRLNVTGINARPNFVESNSLQFHGGRRN